MTVVAVNGHLPVVDALGEAHRAESDSMIETVTRDASIVVSEQNLLMSRRVVKREPRN